jgi:hypothetical protein
VKKKTYIVSGINQDNIKVCRNGCFELKIEIMEINRVAMRKMAPP